MPAENNKTIDLIQTGSALICDKSAVNILVCSFVDYACIEPIKNRLDGAIDA